jgi:hypothetical protein
VTEAEKWIARNGLAGEVWGIQIQGDVENGEITGD